jgi:hypothetical protein
LEAHESADIGLMLFAPASLAEPGFEPRHANHPYHHAGPSVAPGGDESVTISWQAYEKARENQADRGL